MASLRLLKLLLAITVACFVLATGYISYIIYDRQEALQQVSRYKVAWSVNQALVEYMRLEQRVAAFGLVDSTTDTDEVQLRFDILYSRMELLKTREITEFLRDDPASAKTIRELEAVLAVAEPLLQNIKRPGSVRGLIDVLSPLDSRLAALSSEANLTGTQRAAKDQAELLHLHLLFSALAAGLIICSIAFIGMLGWHNRLLGRTHRRLGELTSDLRQASGSLKVKNISLDAALTNMSQGLGMFDAEDRLVVCNQRFGQIFNLPQDSIQAGSPMASILAVAEADEAPCFSEIYSQQQTLIQDSRGGNFLWESSDGRALSVSHAALSDGGWIATYEDVTERRRAEIQIAHMAHYDSLTELANRVLFRQRLEEVMSSSEREGLPLTVFCLDLDRFKEVNDSLGHHTGDELLKAVAARLRASINSTDLVARMGGDEFAILSSVPMGQSECGNFARQLIAEVDRPFVIDGREITVGLSIGIARATGGGEMPDQLLMQADLALYRAKSEGRGIFCFFEPAMDVQLQERKALEADLRKALANGEMDVFYQPLVNASRYEISGFEALLRWRHPVRGMIPPAEFIPIAEDTALIIGLGEWVLQQACTQAMNWPDDIVIAVNLSALQLRSGSLLQTVIDVLSSTELPPRRLELEITESVLMDESESTLATLHKLRSLGVRIALDDFGTGYSSLSYLRNFPFDKIKIDQSFVRDLDTRPDSMAIIRLITGLANSLSMTTTAEGVETEQQFRHLQGAGCTEVQGYYFARPKPASEIVMSLPQRPAIDPPIAMPRPQSV
ncbi:MAG: hypothetical protein JWM58_4387 [Rhizobium sp.]|nr:hypothetical protein [Rhizobium sp.]